MIRMAFGQHKGQALSSIPLEYLMWLASLDDLREPLRTGVAQELEARRNPAVPDPLLAKQIVDVGFKRVAQDPAPGSWRQHERHAGVEFDSNVAASPDRSACRRFAYLAMPWAFDIQEHAAYHPSSNY